MGLFKILIVEDDEVAAEIFGQYASRAEANAEVDWCWNGVEAVVHVDKVRPDLIILDYMMPKLDGLDVVKQVRAGQGSKDAYIAVVSAFVDPEKEKQFLETGADEVLRKPIEFETMKTLIAKAKKRTKQ
jgi:DNA-binding response OmpR family regulator